MATPTHGYEPHRLNTLNNKTTEAAAALRAITSNDPAAAEAIAAVRGLQSTLENGLVSAIRSIQRVRPLSGGGPAFALGGDGIGMWDKTRDGPEPGTLTFQPFSALSALFPGDANITAEEIAARIEEILNAEPSAQQALELEILGRALEEIASDPQLAADLVIELGPDGIAEIYDRLYVLGLHYPLVPTNGGRIVNPEVKGGFIDPLGAVLAIGANQDSEAADVLADVIANTENAQTTRDLVVLAGLARAPGLPPDIAEQLYDRLSEQTDRHVAIGVEGNNQFFQALPDDIDALIAVLFGANPSLVDVHIFDGDDFVEGGEELLADLIETGASAGDVRDEVSVALGDIIERIIENAPDEVLVEVDDNRNQTGQGVIFDIFQLLGDNDLKVAGVDVVEAIAPYLPVITGAYPGSETPFSDEEIGDVYNDLFNDMTTAQVEAALAAILAGALARFDEFAPGEFGTGRRPDIEFGQLLDGVLGPATTAIENIVEDREERAALWRNALDQAFGLLDLPGGKLAGTAIRNGFEQFVEHTITTEQGPLDAAEAIDAIAVEAALVTIYGTDKLHDQIVQNALDDWEATAAGLRTVLTHPNDTPAETAARDRRIQEIKEQLEASLEPGASPVDFDTFLDLPEVRDVTVELFDKVTLSPNGERSN